MCIMGFVQVESRLSVERYALCAWFEISYDLTVVEQSPVKSLSIKPNLMYFLSVSVSYQQLHYYPFHSHIRSSTTESLPKSYCSK